MSSNSEEKIQINEQKSERTYFEQVRAPSLHLRARKRSGTKKITVIIHIDSESSDSEEESEEDVPLFDPNCAIAKARVE